MNLASNTDFIKENKLRVTRLQPKSLKNNFMYLNKKGYGRVPNYLTNIKDQINNELSYLEMMKEAEKKSK